MHHTAAYSADLGTTANTDIAAVADGIIAVTNGHLIPPRDYALVFAAAMSATLTRARLNSGKIRQVNPNYIRPIIAAALPPTDPNAMDLRGRPFVIKGQEELAVEATSGIAMGTERFNAVLLLQAEQRPAPQGDLYTIRATSTTAAVANAWTQVALTFETSLPAGTYAVVGGEYFATNAVAFRVILDGQEWRPGGLGTAVQGSRGHFAQLFGGLGEWGRFVAYSLPRMEVLNNSTDASHTFFLEVIKTG